MTLEMPESTQECLYFTRRSLGNEGQAIAWVKKVDCPECGKAKMGKPINEKTGRAKIRAKEYVCPECGHTEEKDAHEESCQLEVIYTCPKCSHEGEASIPFKRKKIKMDVPGKDKPVKADAFVFNCGKCSEQIAITKKLK